MPSVLQPVSHFVPLTYAIHGLQNVMLKGAGVEGILVDLFAFVVALIVTLLGALWSMGKE